MLKMEYLEGAISIGNVILLDNGNHKNAYKFKENNLAIVTPEVLNVVQIMKAERSNMEKTEDGRNIEIQK